MQLYKHLIRLYVKRNMKTHWLFIFLILGILSGCQKESDTGTFLLNEELTLKTGVVYRSPSDNLSVKVVKITDSRCAIGVVCIWQGEATVNLEVKGSTVFEVEISTYHHPVDTVNNLIFKLIDVLPYPKYQVDVPDSEKTVTLQIDKL
jgi:hypothetical protein